VKVTVIGGGLAGVEAAYQLAKQDIEVDLYEMRPIMTTKAHQTAKLAELICSNSFRSSDINSAIGLLKEEMTQLDSLIMKVALKTAVPAGGALAVDRVLFSEMIENEIQNNPKITVIREELTTIPEGYVIIASGPLTSDSLAKVITNRFGNDKLYFYDSIAIIVDGKTVNMEKAYWKSRYDKGEASYLNCPMNKEQFDVFYDFLISAERAKPHLDEDLKVFEGCMAVEDIAARGRQTLTFGPMKPVGLINPHNNIKPYAVVQLRKENSEGTMYNLVGFQTHLKQGEQRKLLQLIPGLEEATIVRYGTMHRNTYINSPVILNHYYQVKAEPRLFFAGQITGVEGYIESASSGLVAAINMGRYVRNQELLDFTKQTAIGSLAHYVSTANANFQPMNVNFFIVDHIDDRNRKQLYSQRSLLLISTIKDKLYG
jgi:methylenetetrahydrofolate--tRNA-(uracil-5-)-methyltransferase